MWRARTAVRRISAPGQALSLRVPLLPGEKVLTGDAALAGGSVEVRLGANQGEFSWESELAVASEIPLQTRGSDTWVERWNLVVSPVWNVEFEVLAPSFPATAELLPTWMPWPGEGAKVSVTRPEAIPGETVTVSHVHREVTVGQRQRADRLQLLIRSSMGDDFPIKIPGGAEIASLEVDGKTLPARMEGGAAVVPLRPGDQSVVLSWTEAADLSTETEVSGVVLPVGSANITTVLRLPEGRWVLWAQGPLRGPAVQFWAVVAAALVAAFVLGRLRRSPLTTAQWALLAIGLTQVPPAAALTLVAWLFFLAWRGSPSYLELPRGAFNALQVLLAAATPPVLLVFAWVVAAGLLGDPRMFIAGNGSTPTSLQWFQARAADALPQPACWTVSAWWYQLLMLAWALWLAISLLRWLQWGWGQFSKGGCWKKRPGVAFQK